MTKEKSKSISYELSQVPRAIDNIRDWVKCVMVRVGLLFALSKKEIIPEI
ncbi:hypothetical protein BM1374166_00626 [Bartonella tribocorum]|nr:hypothetical protein BM1374166_00626 [Bartonella tribocorum]